MFDRDRGRLELAGWKFCEENILVPHGTNWWRRRELPGLGGSVPGLVRHPLSGEILSSLLSLSNEKDTWGFSLTDTDFDQ